MHRKTEDLQKKVWKPNAVEPKLHKNPEDPEFDWNESVYFGNEDVVRKLPQSKAVVAKFDVEISLAFQTISAIQRSF